MPLMVALLVIAAVVFLVHRIDASLSAPSAPPDDIEALRKLCLGDSAQVERLIDRERNHNPRLSRQEAASRAVRSIKRDQK